MAARHHKTPPYEIMSTLGRGAPAEPDTRASQRPHSEESRAEPAAPAGEAAWWSWSGVGVPIILRVPRGVAILAVVGLIGLLILAYWVGHTRGEAAAIAAHEEQTRQNPEIDNRAAPGPPPGRRPANQTNPTRAGHPSPSPSAANADRAVRAPDGSGDPREPGLNYFIVQTYTTEHAQRCAEFLAERGVETHLVPVDNDRFSIWVVERGFTREELYDSPAYQEWESHLKDLGRAWAEHNGNRHDTFSTMLPAKYKGPDAES